MTDPLLISINNLAVTEGGRDRFLLEAARTIQRFYPQYNWVGFYFLEDDGKLHVGPYVGKETPHTVIELDRGICGAAVTGGETVIVDDVNSDPRYLACSLETRSEIVIPLRLKSKIIGELDIDSAQPAAFSEENQRRLEAVVGIIEKRLGGLIRD